VTRLRGLVLAVLLLAGCGDKARALIAVTVTAEGVTELDAVKVTVKRNGEARATGRFAWAAAPLVAGVYLPAGEGGDVTVTVEGLKGTTVVATAPAQQVSATPGQVTAELKFVLVGGTVAPISPDGGVSADAGGGTVPPPDGSDGDAGVQPVPPDAGMPATDGGDAAASAWGSVAVMAAPAQGTIAKHPTIAVDRTRGHVLLAWIQDNTVVARRWDATKKQWDPVQIVDARVGFVRPSLAIDDQGRALLVWHYDEGISPSQIDPALLGVWVSQSEDGTSWSAPKRLYDNDVADVISLAMAPSGAARVGFLSLRRGPTADVATVATAFIDGTNLMAAHPLHASSNRSPNSPLVVMDHNGAGLITWSQDDPTAPADRHLVVVQPFNGDNLGPEQLLDVGTQEIKEPGVAVNADGKGVVSWCRIAGATSELRAATFASATGLVANPETVTAACRGRVLAAVDGQATTILLFDKLDGTTRNVSVVRRPVGQAWSPLFRLENDDQRELGFNSVIDHDRALTVTAAGDLHATWVKRTGTTTLRPVIRHATSAGTWDAPVLLGPETTLFPNAQAISCSTAGACAATFAYGGGADPGGDNWRIATAFFQ
jgi:predicted lipoprotein with Yx(FWY)xxD motif